MKLTWTFYPKGETASVTLTVIYIHELDNEKLPSGGYLDVERNIAYVDWTTYKRFDTTDVQSRQDAFRRLTPVAKGDGIRTVDGQIVSFVNYRKIASVERTD